jgi:uncharacterized membrane protein
MEFGRPRPTRPPGPPEPERPWPVAATHSARAAGRGQGRLDAGGVRWLHQALLAVLAPFALAAVVGAVLLWPREEPPEVAEGIAGPSALVDATVRTVTLEPCEGTDIGEGIICQALDVQVTSGATAGQVTRFQVPRSGDLPAFHPGDRLVLGYEPGVPAARAYSVVDYQRDHPMLLLGAAFVMVVLVLGRLKGVRALAGLGASLAVVVWFLLPAVLSGTSPILVSLVSAALIAFVALYVAHGFSPRTTVALLGTLASLALVGLLAWAFVGLGRITGFASEEAVLLQFSVAEVNLQGLVLAGIILGALGVLDDVTVTQVAAVWEVRRANPRLGVRELYAAGLAVGRDHIASTVNTLVLAYTGAALPLLLFFRQAERSLSEVLTGELIATEVIRTLVGGIGLAAAVPITTLLAALVASRTNPATVAAAGIHPHPH